MTTILRLIWKARNQLIFRKQTPNPKHLCHHGHTAMNENYRSLNREHGEERDANRRLTPKIGNPKIQGGSKDQTPDGSFVADSSRGAIARLSGLARTTGGWICKMSGRGLGWTSGSKWRYSKPSTLSRSPIWTEGKCGHLTAKYSWKVFLVLFSHHGKHKQLSNGPRSLWGISQAFL